MSLPLRRIIAAVFVIAPLVLTACGGDGRPRRVAASGADEELRKWWNASVSAAAGDAPRGDRRDWQLAFTTWLPNEWPPTPQTIWTRYAYGLDVTMDGASGVSMPFARMECRAGNDPSRVLFPMDGRIKAIATHPVRPHGGWRYSLDDEKRILDLALGLTSTPPPQARGTLGLISYYQSWRLGNAEIAAMVETRHRAFFAWLAKQ